MRLPNVQLAEVPKAKIALYLLNANHRSGKSKARFFAGHGFSVEDWIALANALRQHAQEHEVAKQETTPLGMRFVVEGDMPLPDGVIASVRSVWFIESGESVPRLTTAYPLRRRKKI
jgi:hypothetical protein